MRSSELEIAAERNVRGAIQSQDFAADFLDKKGTAGETNESERPKKGR